MAGGSAAEFLNAAKPAAFTRLSRRVTSPALLALGRHAAIETKHASARLRLLGVIGSGMLWEKPAEAG
jgi:hypothetical protein